MSARFKLERLGSGNINRNIPPSLMTVADREGVIAANEENEIWSAYEAPLQEISLQLEGGEAEEEDHVAVIKSIT